MEGIACNYSCTDWKRTNLSLRDATSIIVQDSWHWKPENSLSSKLTESDNERLQFIASDRHCEVCLSVNTKSSGDKRQLRQTQNRRSTACVFSPSLLFRHARAFGTFFISTVTWRKPLVMFYLLQKSERKIQTSRKYMASIWGTTLEVEPTTWWKNTVTRHSLVLLNKCTQKWRLVIVHAKRLSKSVTLASSQDHLYRKTQVKERREYLFSSFLTPKSSFLYRIAYRVPRARSFAAPSKLAGRVLTVVNFCKSMSVCLSTAFWYLDPLCFGVWH